MHETGNGNLEMYNKIALRKRCCLGFERRSMHRLRLGPVCLHHKNSNEDQTAIKKKKKKH